MEQDRSKWNINTRLNHPQQVSLPRGNRPVLDPVYHSAKFVLSADVPYSEQFLYTRLGNPTTRQLELTLSELQKKEDCIVVASGAAAFTNLFLALMSTGDHIITFRELYRPARLFIRDHLSRFKIENTFLRLDALDQLEKNIRPETKMIYFESPSNPNLSVADINSILKIARSKGILVAMDGTFAGLHQHTEFDIDLMIHSLTKFGNGHGDVIAGCIAGKKDLIKKIRDMSVFLGATLDPQASYLVSRGLKTYMLRYERQTQTAAIVAQVLSKHPKVKKVYYPGLPEHSGHALAKQQMKHMGGVVAFEIDSTAGKSAEDFCHRLQLIYVTASLGSTESLICPTLHFFGLDLNHKDREEMGINNMSVRLSVGLEDPEDILQDLLSALG